MTATNKLPPASDIILLAIKRSSFWICSAVAKAKPPKNRKMVGSANATSAFLVSVNPIAMAKIGINSAVTVTFNASVNHKIPTKTNKVKPLLTCGSNGRLNSKINEIRISTPRIRLDLLQTVGDLLFVIMYPPLLYDHYFIPI